MQSSEIHVNGSQNILSWGKDILSRARKDIFNFDREHKESVILSLEGQRVAGNFPVAYGTVGTRTVHAEEQDAFNLKIKAIQLLQHRLGPYKSRGAVAGEAVVTLNMLETEPHSSRRAAKLQAAQELQRHWLKHASLETKKAQTEDENVLEPKL